MSQALRILHTADSHIGADLPARPRLATPRRGDDFVSSFRRVIHRAFELDVDLVIHSGDLFNRSKPSSRALIAATEPLLEVAVAGIPVVIVPGNHERSTIPASVLLSHPNIHIAADPRTIPLSLRGLRVAVAAFPCLRRDSAAAFPEALRTTEWSRMRADLRILAVHQTFESATCGPNSFRFRSGDDVVDRTSIPAEFDYVAAGHVHRHQQLTMPDDHDPPIVYCGSPDRISFAEASEPKGCVLVQQVDGRLVPTFLEHDVRPMSLWPMDVTGMTRSQIREAFETILTALPANAIAQVRMSGCCTSGALRDLRVTALARESRPDVLLSVTTRDVEHMATGGVPRSTGGTGSVFVRLRAPNEEVFRATSEDTRCIPSGCGVYAMYDRADRVLYIGKSKTVRARVRAHIRGDAGANFFRGWSRHIAEIEVRAACSDLEALLIEAELVRRSRPPFNRQMRRWKQYCYLGENGLPFRQLEVQTRPRAGEGCFGPFRSRHLARSLAEVIAEQFRLARCPQGASDDGTLTFLKGADSACLCDRYYRGLCLGPCAHRTSQAAYGGQVAARNALLRGENDSAVRELELHVEQAGAHGAPNEEERRLSRTAMTLRAAFEYAATLREAEQLVGGLLLMPGLDGSCRSATLTPRGAHFDVLHNNPADAQRLLVSHRRFTCRLNASRIRRLPTAVLDSLCMIARQLRRGGEEYRFLAYEETTDMHARTLLATAFGGQGVEA